MVVKMNDDLMNTCVGKKEKYIYMVIFIPRDTILLFFRRYVCIYLCKNVV